MKHSGTRHKARNRAVDLLFEGEAKGVSPLSLIDERRAIYPTDDSVGTIHDYTAAAVAGVVADQPQLDAVIASHLDRWQLDRLPAVDRAILRLATWELFNATDVDPVVIVDEAVQLAKDLSTDNSPAYVNGVLAKIADLAPQVRAAAAAQPADPDTAGEDSAPTV